MNQDWGTCFGTQGIFLSTHITKLMLLSKFWGRIIDSVVFWVLFQIARALAVFSIDEVVIFDESVRGQIDSDNSFKRSKDPNVFLARILQYLECPQYLRKIFFPKHLDLQYAGNVNLYTTVCANHNNKINDQ